MIRLVVAAVLLVPLSLVCLSPASAGFFDNLRQKAEDAVSDLVSDKAEEAVSGTPQSEETENSSPSAPTTKTATSNDNEKTTLPTSQLQMARGVFSAAPEIFQSRPQDQFNEWAFKQIVEVFFPEEHDNIRNEFRWRKNRANYQEKILVESKGAPTSFEVAPWINNASSSETPHQINNLELTIGRYDFEREAWPVSITVFSLPWMSPNKHAFVDYEITNFDYRGKTYDIPMSIEEAEKFDGMFQETGRRAFGHFTFAITDVLCKPEDHPAYKQYERDLGKLPEDRRNRFIADKLPPHALVTIEDNKVDIYYAKTFSVTSTNRSDYIYMGTLDTVKGTVMKLKN